MRICDITLRASARASGNGYTADQRVETGRALDRLGVPLVGTGSPSSSAVARETLRRLASDLSADVVALCEPTTDDVEAALSADADVVEVAIPVSDSRLEAVLGCSRDEAFDRAEAALLRAHEGGVDAHLTLSDAFRAEVPAIAGAFGRFDCPVVLADSVGARTPPFVAGFLRTLADASADLTRAGVRFHDDLGCATANTIVAAETGIDRVDTSVASLGERAGVAATEEVVAATETAGGDAGIVEEETVPACEDVLRTLDESVDERKAVLGEAATTHEVRAGAEAVLDDPSAFEAFDPETVGGRRRLVFGESTGREGARRLLERAGQEPSEDAIESLLERLSEEGPIELDEALAFAADA
ncbi:homocitrate synthase/isopropylmalate synthase family protein [Natronomonas marina]|jgi:isopropylmalate/homocitrate/citramalate synthase|uniref:homocitrate synthase/isopropylmalate synthase family protein n=1 Tax=Natronomonas marina TaxID=2961939 RepID=UPI0020C967FA|nr:citramalate synthase [Natronomonas marina]